MELKYLNTLEEDDREEHYYTLIDDIIEEYGVKEKVAINLLYKIAFEEENCNFPLRFEIEYIQGLVKSFDRRFY
jgi:hypothetical protein